MASHIIDIETTSLAPQEGKVICITILDIETSQTQTFYSDDEFMILEQFWASVSNSEQLIHFNGNSFDLPYLIHRSIVNNVKITIDNLSKKSLDLRQIASCFFFNYDKFVKGNLAYWAGVMNIPISTENGSHIKELYDKGDWSEISKHCNEDIKITFELYKRLEYLNLINKNG